MPKTQKRYEDCSKSCSSAARIPLPQMQDSSPENRDSLLLMGQMDEHERRCSSRMLIVHGRSPAAPPKLESWKH